MHMLGGRFSHQISDRGAKRRGPKTKPRRKVETPNVEMVREQP